MELEDVSDEHISASEEEGEEDDDRKHAHMLDAILSLDGKKKYKLTQRTVPATEISEFNFKKSGDVGKVRLHELVTSLRETVKHGQLKKQLKSLKQRNRVADTPLARTEKERIQRSVAYDKTKEEVSVWEPVIKENRKAEQLQFPLQRPELSFTTEEFVNRFEPRTPLEVEIAAVLHGSESRQTVETILTPAEERAMRAMDIQEAKARRAELQKYRALLSFKEAKAKRQKKIKSKRYHRVLRQEKLKAEKKSMAELQMTDPDAYLEKLKQLDKDRMQERMSLKHKTGGKFARRQKIFGKYNDETRQAVQDMLQKNKELTEKLHVDSESDNDSNSDEDGSNIHNSTGGSNPWMSAPSVLKSTNFSRLEMLENKEVFNDSDESVSDHGNDVQLVSDKNKHKAPAVSVEDFVTNSSEERKKELKVKKKRSKKRRKGLINESEPNLSGSEKHESVHAFHEKDDIDRVSCNGNRKQFLTSGNEHEISTVLVEDSVSKVKKEKKKQQVREKGVKKKMKRSVNQNEKKIMNEKEFPKTLSALSEDNPRDETFIVECLNRKQTLEEIDMDVSSDEGNKNDVEDDERQQTSHDKMRQADSSDNNLYSKVANQSLDPKKIFTVETELVNSAQPDIEENEDDLDPASARRITIAQAFADDDVLEEFSKEKQEIADRDKPKDINLTLPGWGEWGGTGLKPSKRKRKRFTFKAPPGPPRQDRHLGHVIINEQKDKSITKYQVNQLPFPFTSAQQFEKSIRAPIGKTWNPETAFKQLIKPKVVTKMGTIISPMDKETASKLLSKNQQEEDDGEQKEKRNSKFKRKKRRNNKH